MSTKICCNVSYQIKFSLWNKTKHVFLNNDQENKMIYEIPRPTIHISDNFNDQSFSTPINSFVHIKTIKRKRYQLRADSLIPHLATQAFIFFSSKIRGSILEFIYLSDTVWNWDLAFYCWENHMCLIFLSF